VHDYRPAARTNRPAVLQKGHRGRGAPFWPVIAVATQKYPVRRHPKSLANGSSRVKACIAARSAARPSIAAVSGGRPVVIRPAFTVLFGLRIIFFQRFGQRARVMKEQQPCRLWGLLQRAVVGSTNGKWQGRHLSLARSLTGRPNGWSWFLPPVRRGEEDTFTSNFAMCY
jgi:hypothetical protein